MSDYADYDAVITALQNAQAGSDTQFKKISDSAPSDCDINQIVENSGNITVVRNNNGDVIGYDNIYTIPNSPNISDLQVNSNSDHGSYGSAQGSGGYTRGGGAGRYAGSYYVSQGSSDMEAGARDVNDNNINVVSGDISPAWAAVSALAKFGKNVSTAGNELIDGMAAYLHDTFNAYMKLAGTGFDAFRTLFGLDNNGNVTMYMDADTIGALAIAARESGAFNNGGLGPSTPPSVGMTINNSDLCYMTLQQFANLYGNGNVPGFSADVLSNIGVLVKEYSSYYLMCPTSPHTDIYVKTTGPYTITSRRDYYSDYTLSSRIRLSTGHFWYIDSYGDAIGGSMDYDKKYVCAYTDNPSYIYSLVIGVQNVPPPEGVSDQTGATIPVDAITGADPHVVAQNLATNYPAVMGSPIQIVVLDDSCNEKTINYYSIPISYGGGGLNVDAPITGGLQVNPSFNPDVQLDLPDIDMSRYVEEIINQLRGTGAGRNVVNTQVDPETGAEFPVVLPGSIPNTGSGITPAWLPDDNVGSNIMWQVYNPTSATLRAFGSWLWSNGNIVTQFLKIMSNPMDAILGLHKVYVTPNRSGTATIVCGNLDSEVSSITVGNQYVEIDCGSVWITEYFGNVFDYSPYTDISVYLPFIGIVNVATNDVMRGEMSIKYTVDVYTGACIAEISINRDGVGGVLYQFNGNAAVEYPITAMSYNNAIMGALGIANGVLGAIPSIAMGNPIGVAGSLASSMIHATMGQRENMQRSGSFSGNAGAMGAKKPYVIITRPIPETAEDFESWEGQSANATVEIGDCTGFIKCRYFEAEFGGAYKSELDELYNLMQGGVIV